jgi:hypothetical protein
MRDHRAAYSYLAIPPDTAFHSRQGRPAENGAEQHIEAGEEPGPDATQLQLAALLIQHQPCAMAHASRTEDQSNRAHVLGGYRSMARMACASAAVCIVVREFIFCSANSSVVPVKY